MSDRFKGHINRVMEHKHALIFVGGIATALIGKKIIESETTKKACANVMAKALTAKSEVEESIQNIKDDAEDIRAEAERINKKEICVDITEDEEE